MVKASFLTTSVIATLLITVCTGIQQQPEPKKISSLRGGGRTVLDVTSRNTRSLNWKWVESESESEDNYYGRDKVAEGYYSKDYSEDYYGRASEDKGRRRLSEADTNGIVERRIATSFGGEGSDGAVSADVQSSSSSSSSSSSDDEDYDEDDYYESDDEDDDDDDDESYDADDSTEGDDDDDDYYNDDE